MKEIKNIEKFKKVGYYDLNGKISDEKAESLGLLTDDYKSFDECAYQCAYDISNDWAKEEPTWDDVQGAYKQGVDAGIDYANSFITLEEKIIINGVEYIREDVHHEKLREAIINAIID